MKTKIYSIFAVLSLSLAAWSQGVGINETGANPNPSAGLDVDFNNKGFLLPRMTTAELNAIVNPATGLMVYNTSISSLVINDGTTTNPIWNCISGSGGTPMSIVETLDCSSSVHNGGIWRGQNAVNVNSIIPYSNGNGGTYSGQVFLSSGVTGLTATLESGIFANGSGDLTLNITGVPASVGTALFEINIGFQTCTFARTVQEAVVPNICNPANPTIINNVTNPTTGRTWMDRNLGANRASISSTDAQSYGSLYQWGRGSDGHQCVNRYSGDGVTTSSTTSTLSSTDTPNHGSFIVTSTNPHNWRSSLNNFLWRNTYGTNNPCPHEFGYRLPTNAEFEEERDTWPPSNAGGFASVLKLPYSGWRTGNGTFQNVGTNGYSWTFNVTSTSANYFLTASNGSGTYVNARSIGMSVRCIKHQP